MLATIHTDKAPQAIGPYSQAVKCNGLVFVSGQIPINPATGELLAGTAGEKTRLVMENIGRILEEAGTSFDKVVKTTIYLTDLNEFDEVNKIYGEFFSSHKPARATVQVARLPKDVSVEIDAIASLE
ncbi:MAG: RidA family protein [Cyanobacteria bacterium HKST-UBA01]|nr:RidA family protein [Cyanobacteria bacterium HKST-UBA01]